MKKTHMTLFAMTYCNKISLLKIPLSAHLFIYLFSYFNMPGFEMSENISERSATIIFSLTSGSIEAFGILNRIDINIKLK